MYGLKQAFLALVGFSGGFIVAAGIFALITTIGVIARLAGKTHTGRFAKVYETSIALGGTVGNLISLYGLPFAIGKLGLMIYGGAAGIFVGVLAMSLAESLNVTAIFARRIRLSKGIPYIVLGIALGRGIGAILMYSQNWHN